MGLATTVILGHPVPFGSSQLRAWSIAIYSLFLAPGLNLILPMGFFLALFLGCQACYRHEQSDPNLQQSLDPDHGRLPSIMPAIICMVLLLAINLIFMVDIELTLHENRSLNDSTWTFGQILAMLLLVLPLRDIVETISARRETKRKEELARHEKRHLAQLTETLRNSIRDGGTPDGILDLVKKGADVNTMVEGRHILFIPSAMWTEQPMQVLPILQHCSWRRHGRMKDLLSHCWITVRTQTHGVGAFVICLES
jgi:hypothetical protein